MPKMTSGYAKNTIRRALRAVVDPEPSRREIKLLWDFFGASCAYCGRSLSRELHEGHIDHLVPTTSGGANHISNRVLCCAPCNEAKRDDSWLEFLHTKVGGGNVFETRRQCIAKWRSSQAQARPASVIFALLKQKTKRAIAAFDEAVLCLRQARKESRLITPRNKRTNSTACRIHPRQTTSKRWGVTG